MKSFCWLLLLVVFPVLPMSGQSSPDATNGYITAVLRCTSAPRSPPPVGQVAIGPDYVIMTVARGDPTNFVAAQQIVTDAIFESLMPLYCALPVCGGNRVQWNVLTYDANGNPKVSGGPRSGGGFHYCPVTNGYVTAIVRGESASLPTLPPVGQVAIGHDAVVLTLADANPLDLEAAHGLAYDAVFQGLMRRYCALLRGAAPGQVSGSAQWTVATFDAKGNPQLSACALSGCDVHECIVEEGFITATLRSECTSAPLDPPSAGGIKIGPDYVMMTVLDAAPEDIERAQQFATDQVFESLMPLYCALPRTGCVTNRVQWNLLTYDAGGTAKVSSSPTSGPEYHHFDSCALTPQQRVGQLMVWLNVDIAAGLLKHGHGRRLTARLNAVTRELRRGSEKAVDSLKDFLGQIQKLVENQEFSPAAAQTLITAASALIADLEG